MICPPATLIATAAIAAASLPSSQPRAQPTAPSATTYPGLEYWPPAARPAYAQYEAALNAAASTDKLMAWHELLASEPHVAGTDGDHRTAERIAKAFEDMGLEVERHEIWVYLCRPIAATLEVVDPSGARIPLGIKESPVEGDTFTENPELWPGWNAWSGSGDVTADVVYANYGTKEDFEKLAELGISVQGKVVLARYGGNFRGYKAKFAEAAGAAGLVIFTDPADTGYMKGLMYPEGGYQTETCIQRGGIATLPYSGDPLTPFVEAKKDAHRQDIAKVPLPTIPVQPVGWAAAKEIISRMKGPAVPAGWQGGLPHPYRLTGGESGGPGGPQVRVHVEQKREIAKTFNILGTLRGEKHPDQLVILGSHHDAWGFGASDPLAGTIAVLESARCFTDQANAGHRPARSLVFAAWGAEEFGIIGSVEWVEANRDKLFTSAVAYINLDMASMGPDFGSAASPSLRQLISECAASVPQARAPDKTVLDAWQTRTPDPDFPGFASFGDVGGGSDHVGFLCHIAVPSAGLGAGGSPGTAWHTTRDTLQWYWKVVGPDYEPALMITRMTNAMAARLACAPLIPLDPARPLTEMRRGLARISQRGLGLKSPILVAGAEGAPVAREFAALDTRAAEVATLAVAVNDRLLAAIGRGDLASARLHHANRLMMALDRAWIREQGVPGRPWFRNLQAATDENSGYAAWVLPALARAVERGDKAELTRAVALYDEVLRTIEQVLKALDALAAPPPSPAPPQDPAR